MPASFFFYDLETSGFDPRVARVMQFAGQRTDMELKPIGEPINVLIAQTPDVLPDPDAVLITGITPQQTIGEGLSEAEFLKIFSEQAVQPDTIFVGFNSVRFDDEFMRFLNYRNFYDAYEWQWRDGCSRWDLLDVARMTRALRPDGINWPFAPDGKPANRLEFLTKVNKLSHEEAHDALSDVRATIAVAQLTQTKQPDLFSYLLKMRTKKNVAELVGSAQPFVYTSGRYPSNNLHTTVAIQLVKHPHSDGSLVYDLRHDPTPFLDMNTEQLVAAWKYTKDPEILRLPVKTLKYNRCPAIAPLGVAKDAAAQARINLTLETVTKHRGILAKHQADFAQKVLSAVERLDAIREQAQTGLLDNQQDVDKRLYDGFIPDADKPVMKSIISAPADKLSSFSEKLHDGRLKNLLPLYIARNHPATLSSDERQAWDEFCHRQLFEGGHESRASRYFARLQELANGKPTQKQQYLLEELRLYGESVLPADAVG